MGANISLAELHTTGLGSSIQPIQISLQSLPTLQQINTPTNVVSSVKLQCVQVDPLAQIIYTNIRQVSLQFCVF